ncbi:MAG TPA: hypothetical protein DEB46_04180, partial [Myxococcales bacterium]|nr:hypothetical protein [Myxococcales bacterium]
VVAVAAVVTLLKMRVLPLMLAEVVGLRLMPERRISASYRLAVSQPTTATKAKSVDGTWMVK